METTLAPLRSLSRPSWLPADIWPFDTYALSVEKSLIAVTDSGSGPVLLFYTGIGSFVWRDVIVRLSSAFRCVTLDPPGIGLSGPVARGHATLERSAHTVEAVIDALDLDGITLVAHDTGGPAALAAAAREPGRFRGLVGVNTFGWRPSGAAFRTMLSLMGSSAMRRVSMTTGALARVTASAFGAGRHLDERSRRAYRIGFHRAMGAFHDYLHDARDSRVYSEVTNALAGPLAKLPLMTIFGEKNDPLGFQPQWKALFPGARQVVVRNGNHFPMCDDPELVAAEIRAWHHDRVR